LGGCYHWRSVVSRPAPQPLSAPASIIAGCLAAGYPEWGWIAKLAVCFKQWAYELASDIAARNRRKPGWRGDPGFNPA